MEWRGWEKLRALKHLLMLSAAMGVFLLNHINTVLTQTGHYAYFCSHHEPSSAG